MNVQLEPALQTPRAAGYHQRVPVHAVSVGALVGFPAPEVEMKAGEGSSATTESTLYLVRQVREGDERALEVLCQRYLPRLQRWASGRLPDYARDLLATDDLVQDALLQTVRKIDGFRSDREGAFQAYVRQILLNRMRDQIRRPHLIQALESGVQAFDSEVSPLEELIGQETLERYESALKALAPADREAVIARVEMAGTYEELAEILGKPSADAARMAVARALVRLAKEMGRAR